MKQIYNKLNLTANNVYSCSKMQFVLKEHISLVMQLLLHI